MAPREYRRFPHSETCAECPARRWYLENGRRYCENGHEVEGYIQYDVDEEDNFGKQGSIARKAKERRTTERKHLTGQPARELYLECLQFLLRKQLLWLVRKKGFHPELEAVCRDLWVLRVREFPGLVGKRDEGKKGRRRSRGTGSESEGTAQGTSGSELEMFSTQSSGGSETEGEGVATGREEGDGVKGRKRRSWKKEVWPLPGVMDTLAIVYLGCVLRGEPVRVGDVWRWARNNQIPFLMAANYLPKSWRDRLPGWAHHALLTRYVRFEGGELHRAVMNLMLGYKENHGLVFPEISTSPMLFLHIRDLALPPEVHPFAQKICRLLNLRFSFPTRQPPPTKYRFLDIPDVLLIAALVVATKHLYPMDGIKRYPRDANDPICRQMDWKVWEEEFSKQSSKKTPILEYERLDPQEIWTMDKEQINELLNWFQETQIDSHKPDDTEIERFFPLAEVPGIPEVPEASQEEIEARLVRIQSAMKTVQPVPDPGDGTGRHIKRIGSDYRRYRSEEELEGHVKKFYEVAAEVSGLSVRDLVRAVYTLEEMLKVWQTEEKRRLKREEEGSDEE